MNLAEFKQKRDEFLTYIKVEKNLADNTYRAYETDLQQFIEFWETITATEGLELPLRSTLERFLVSLYYKKIDKSSIARKLSCFKSFEKFVRIYDINLELKLARPRLDKKLPIYLSVDEIFHLLDKINNDELPTKRPYRDKAILELLYATGIRCSELINIKLSDVDFSNKVIRIFGKGRKERLALFGQKAHDKLMDYLSKERNIESVQEYLFVNARNTKLTARSVQRILEMFRAFLKIDRKITPHKIRHSFATHMLNQGVDLRVVQELLGHATLSSTEKYTHVSSQQLAKMCDTLHPIHSMVKTRKT